MDTGNYPKLYLYRRIVQAKLFIDSHYAEDVDLSHIADEAFFSKFHFIRLFKQAYGKTPHHYLTQVRISNAIRMLSQGCSVAETCFKVGFGSSTLKQVSAKHRIIISPRYALAMPSECSHKDARLQRPVSRWDSEAPHLSQHCSENTPACRHPLTRPGK